MVPSTQTFGCRTERLRQRFCVSRSSGRSARGAVPRSTADGSLRACSELQPRELRAERLLSHGIESDHELQVVVERFDGDNGAHAELRVLDAQTRPEPRPLRLVFVLVRIDRLFANAAAVAAAARIAVPELRERTLR